MIFSSGDLGNAYTREPLERYISPVYEISNRKPVQIAWEAEVPRNTQLKFQLRWAENEGKLKETNWRGPGGEKSYYEVSGQDIKGVESSAMFLF